MPIWNFVTKESFADAEDVDIKEITTVLGQKKKRNKEDHEGIEKERNRYVMQIVEVSIVIEN